MARAPGGPGRTSKHLPLLLLVALVALEALEALEVRYLRWREALSTSRSTTAYRKRRGVVITVPFSSWGWTSQVTWCHPTTDRQPNPPPYFPLLSLLLHQALAKYGYAPNKSPWPRHRVQGGRALHFVPCRATTGIAIKYHRTSLRHAGRHSPDADVNAGNAMRPCSPQQPNCVYMATPDRHSRYVLWADLEKTPEDGSSGSMTFPSHVLLPVDSG